MNSIPYQSAIGSPLGRITAAGRYTSAGTLVTDKLRIFGSYAIVYCLNGMARYRDARNFQTAIHAGDLIIVFPNLGHSYGPPPGQSWEEYYIVFDGPIFNLWGHTGALNPARPVLHLEPLNYWRHRLDEIIAPNLPPLERVCRLQSVLADMLANFQRDVTAERNEEWLKAARALLATNIAQPLYVDAIARRLKLSPETFRKKFARLAGVAPYQYRLTQVIDQACRLVHEGCHTNKEIAAQLGFSDEFHFSRSFKRITGRSPAQFRALLRPSSN